MDGMVNLQRLMIAANQKLADISELSGLENLVALLASETSISNISAIADLANLTTIEFAFTRVSDISPVAGLTQLESVGFYSAQITDISPLVENPGIGEGDLVDLRENPIDCLAEQDNLQTLVDRGVNLQIYGTCTVRWDAGVEE